jgi:predicted AAA+ superfamily ATPase
MTVISNESIYTVLRSFNPWWQSGSIQTDLSPAYKRLAFFDARRQLTQPDYRRAVVLLGARRVGKTTIQYQLIESLLNDGVAANGILYFSLDHPILKEAGINRVLEVYHESIYAKTDAYYFLDEIQRQDSWEAWLKTLYDTRKNTRIVVTGSASAALTRGASESGVGRFRTITVPTLSFYEYCELLKLNAPVTLPADFRPSRFFDMDKPAQADIMLRLATLGGHFNRYLTLGGFPELASAASDTGAARVIRDDIIDKVLKRDIPDVYAVRNPGDLERIFLYICNTTSDILSIEAMCKELNGVSRPTAENYIGYLTHANLVYKSMPVALGSRAVLKASPKMYVADSAIRTAILMDDVLLNPTELGKVVETTVYKHVRAFFDKQSVRTGYYRGGDKDKEIDIVVDGKNKILIEAKYRNQAKLLTRSALNALAGENASAYLLTKRPDDYGLNENKEASRVFRIPAFAFLYLLGHCEKVGAADI